MRNYAKDIYKHQNYDTLISVIFNLTSYNILKNPLYDDEGFYYKEFKHYMQKFDKE